MHVSLPIIRKMGTPIHIKWVDVNNLWFEFRETEGQFVWPILYGPYYMKSYSG